MHYLTFHGRGCKETHKLEVSEQAKAQPTNCVPLTSDFLFHLIFLFLCETCLIFLHSLICLSLFALSVSVMFHMSCICIFMR